MNRFKGSVAMLRWTKTPWLVITIYVTFLTNEGTFLATLYFIIQKSVFKDSYLYQNSFKKKKFLILNAESIPVWKVPSVTSSLF